MKTAMVSVLLLGTFSLATSLVLVRVQHARAEAALESEKALRAQLTAQQLEASKPADPIEAQVIEASAGVEDESSLKAMQAEIALLREAVDKLSAQAKPDGNTAVLESIARLEGKLASELESIRSLIPKAPEKPVDSEVVPVDVAPKAEAEPEPEVTPEVEPEPDEGGEQP